MSTRIDEAYSPEAFRTLGHSIVDMLADHLASSAGETSRTLDYSDPEAEFRFWQEDFSSGTVKTAEELIKNVIDRTIHLHSPNYMGHQVGVVLPVAAIGSLTSAILNNGMGVYEMGMAGNAMEKVITNYMAQKIGFGERAGGLITSGGSLGNLTALLTAIAAMSSKPELRNCAIIIPESAHYSLRKSALAIGIDDANIIQVPVTGDHKMQTGMLPKYFEQAIQRGLEVVCIVASACSTATGTYDDLVAVGNFCREKKVWFHVDGAHGLPVMFSPLYRHLIAGVELADSVIIDFHKLMMVPSLSTAVIFKEGKHAYKTFSQHADYLWLDEEAEEWFNSGKRTFECTKTMGILNIYLLFKLYSEDIFRQSVEKVYGLARAFTDLVKADDNFELACEPESNIVCFRYKFPGNTNEGNLEIRQKLLEEGKFYIVQTTFDEELYLRISIMNPLTAVENLQALLKRIEELAAGIQQI
ncbi:MAG: aminotransferase class I/II-fold pyridoxal phosphate-dependent enzyme [Chitinophagaceae bacterium]